MQFNTEGLGYAQNGNPNPLGGPNRDTYIRVSKQMTRMWVSFANYGDPNKNLGGKPPNLHLPTPIPTPMLIALTNPHVPSQLNPTTGPSTPSTTHRTSSSSRTSPRTPSRIFSARRA